MDRVAAKIAQEIAVLLEHDNVNAGAGQQISEHHPRRPAPGDSVATAERFPAVRHEGLLLEWACDRR
jgi:hypothetical protein